MFRTAIAAWDEKSASSSRSSSFGSTRAGVSITRAPAGPRRTTSGAATIVPASGSPPAGGWLIGTPFSIARLAAASRLLHDAGAEPALAIGTRRPCSSWNTTQRSASVASTVACATASSTRSITPEDASVWPTVRSRSRSRAHRRVASARSTFVRSSSRANGLVR